MFNWTFKRFSLISVLESPPGAGLSNYAIRHSAANCLLSLTETVKLLFTMQINVNKNNWLHISQAIKLSTDDTYLPSPLWISNTLKLYLVDLNRLGCPCDKYHKFIISSTCVLCMLSIIWNINLFLSMSEGTFVQVQWIYHKIIHLALALRLQYYHTVTKHY